jgi:hypothetical protein
MIVIVSCLTEKSWGLKRRLSASTGRHAVTLLREIIGRCETSIIGCDLPPNKLLLISSQALGSAAFDF